MTVATAVTALAPAAGAAETWVTTADAAPAPETAALPVLTAATADFWMSARTGKRRPSRATCYTSLVNTRRRGLRFRDCSRIVAQRRLPGS